mmetsp:Transcript_33436/g.99590  ORF Transcript_33436/g.99590 Transcript_33436/m.99590 type:complete len:261 (-) Transcript_33436:228-1010(-)
MIPIVSSTLNAFRDRREESAEEMVADMLSEVMKCMKDRQWEKLLGLLASGEVAAKGCETNLLHTLCNHRPSNLIVETLLRQNPRLAAIRDNLQRTPLHTAVECGASSGVVRRLIEADPSIAEAKDTRGRTSLILACEEMGKQKFKSEEHEQARMHRLTKAIRLLTQLSPESSAIEDNDEVTALEHAISSEAPKEVIKELQKVTARAVKQVNTEKKRRRSMDMISSSRSCLTDRPITLESMANSRGTMVRRRSSIISATTA